MPPDFSDATPPTGEFSGTPPTVEVTGNFNNLSVNDPREFEISDGDKFSRAFYDPAVKESGLSFEGINGLIDPSKEDAYALNHRHIQRKSFSDGAMVGLTGNQNYQSERFFGRANEDDKRLWRLVPGACIEFYLPKKSNVILTWQIGGATGAKFEHHSHLDRQFGVPSMGLFIDDYLFDDPDVAGVSRPTGSRQIPRSVHRGTESDTNGVQSNRIHRPHRDRVWSGHYFVDLEAGWHSAGIGVYQKYGALKLRSRNMKVIWFPKPTS